LIRAEISAVALRGNLARIREVARGSRVLAVIKANAYGHGMAAVAQALDDADAFGVARLDEALVLRAAGVRKPVLLMEGVPNAEQFAEAARQHLEFVVHEEGQIALLEQAPADQRFVVWLKIDTGMNRLGFRSAQLGDVFARLAALGPKLAELRLMTHFVAADEPGVRITQEQIAQFATLAKGRGNARSLANSAGIFGYPDSHADWVRPGICLYGASPFPGQSGAALGLTPVMRLTSSVIAVRAVTIGETVGYGGSWRAKRDSRVAIVAAGYADGLPRLLEQGTPVLVNGVEAALVGRVSMDMIAIDVTGLPDVLVGDPVVLWGPELPVEQVAAHAGTISYELLCAVSGRVPRVMV
jgi:alanine racemase